MASGLVTAAALPVAPDDPDVPLDDREWTVEEYLAAAYAGEFGRRDVELLDGRVYEKMVKNPRHSFVVKWLVDALAAWLPANFHSEQERPLQLVRNAPEPDVLVVRGSLRNYRHRHPTAADVALAIEVAESSLRRDLGTKFGIYAASNVPEYWVVDLIHDQINVFTDPDPAAETYGAHQTFVPGQTIPLTLDDVVVANIDVADVLS